MLRVSRCAFISPCLRDGQLTSQCNLAGKAGADAAAFNLKNDLPNFLSFFKDLRAANPNAIITTDTSAGPWLDPTSGAASTDLSAFAELIDYFTVMVSLFRSFCVAQNCLTFSLRRRTMPSERNRELFCNHCAGSTLTPSGSCLYSVTGPNFVSSSIRSSPFYRRRRTLSRSSLRGLSHVLTPPPYLKALRLQMQPDG